MKMESKSNEAEPIIQRFHYDGSLLLCFMVSLGIFCAFLPVIPFGEGNEDSTRGDLTYITTRFILTAFMILFDIFVWYIVRKRDSFHKEQEVFWPLRCRHCAQAVGFIQKHTQEGKMNISKSDPGSTSCCRFPVKTSEAEKSSLSLPNESSSGPFGNLGCPNLSRSMSLESLDIKIRTRLNEHDMSNLYQGHRMDCCQMKTKTEEKMSAPNFESVNDDHDDREMKGTCDIVNQLYYKPHKSLLNTFYIFGTVAAINLPIPVIANVMCIVTLDNSLSRHIVLAGQVLVDITFTALIFFGMFFFKNFYDAVFVAKEKFVFPLSIAFAGCFWVAMGKIIYPLGDMTSAYVHLDYPCSLPGKFGVFVKQQERTLTPFYAECAIISGAMMWQMWYSVLPQSLLKTRKSTSHFQNLGQTHPYPFWEKIRDFVKNICSCTMVKFTTLGSSEDERGNLLSPSKDIKDRKLNFPEQPLNVPPAFAFCVFLGIVYFSLSQVLEYSNLGLEGSESTNEITLTYLRWTLQTVFYLPLLALYRYRIFLTDSGKSFRPRKNVSLVSGLIGGHDRIILISCIGTFTLNIFRFASALGILIQTSRPPEDIVLACYTGVFAIFQTYSTWVMTSFLVIVQRQEIQGTAETKWTLICLIYTGVLEATQWAIDSVEIESWIELSTFYGPTQGNVIGVLLEPLTSLYGIHSAMIAYEAYKTIRNDFQLRRKSTKANDII